MTSTVALLFRFWHLSNRQTILLPIATFPNCQRYTIVIQKKRILKKFIRNRETEPWFGASSVDISTRQEHGTLRFSFGIFKVVLF